MRCLRYVLSMAWCIACMTVVQSAVHAESTCTVQIKSLVDERVYACDAFSLHEIATFTTPHHRHITVCENQDKKRFIVKQETRSELYWHMAVAREMLSASVAESVGILANRVAIIPALCPFPGKKRVNFPATLHEVVPGKNIHELPKSFKDKLFIQQYMKDSVPQKKWGLSREVIQSMTIHPDLPVMVGFDTFIACADRHKGNYFFCAERDHFYLIDLESSWNKDLAFYACRYILSLLSHGSDLSAKELEALKIYRDTIKNLLYHYSPESLYKKMVECTVRGGLITRTLKKNVGAELLKYERTIRENYSSCQKLVRLLDKLFDQRTRYRHKKRKK